MRVYIFFTSKMAVFPEVRSVLYVGQRKATRGEGGEASFWLLSHILAVKTTLVTVFHNQQKASPQNSKAVKQLKLSWKTVECCGTMT